MSVELRGYKAWLVALMDVRRTAEVQGVHLLLRLVDVLPLTLLHVHEQLMLLNLAELLLLLHGLKVDEERLTVEHLLLHQQLLLLVVLQLHLVSLVNLLLIVLVVLHVLGQVMLVGHEGARVHLSGTLVVVDRVVVQLLLWRVATAGLLRQLLVVA